MSNCSGSSSSKGGGSSALAKGTLDPHINKLSFGGNVAKIETYLKNELNWDVVSRDSAIKERDQIINDKVEKVKTRMKLSGVQENSEQWKQQLESTTKRYKQVYKAANIDPGARQTGLKVLGSLVEGGLKLPKDVKMLFAKKYGGTAQFEKVNGKYVIRIGAENQNNKPSSREQLNKNMRDWTVDYLYGGKRMAAVITHEIAHVKHFEKLEQRGGSSNTSDWAGNARKLYYKTRPKISGSIISDYATKNHYEKIAEAYTAKKIYWGKLDANTKASVKEILTAEGMFDE